MGIRQDSVGAVRPIFDIELKTLYVSSIDCVLVLLLSTAAARRSGAGGTSNGIRNV